MKVLIVDDDRNTLNLMRQLFEMVGAVVTEANNGEEGIQQYHTFKPDVIVSDVSMPIMDGITMSKHLLNIDPALNIIILSAHNEVNYKEQHSELENAIIMHKPISIRAVKSAISSFK